MKRPVLLCFLLVWSLMALGQSKETVRRIGSEDTMGGADWRFQPGDNPAWARPDFDARTWSQHNIEEPVLDNQALWKAGQGWFRLKFRARRSIHNADMTLSVVQFGASEFFLDGKRIGVLKPTDYDSGGSQRITQLIPVRFADTSQHVLAIHYRFRRDPILYTSASIDPIKISFHRTAEAAHSLIESVRASTFMDTLFAGVFGLLALLHFLFYRANRQGKVNRTLALTMLCFSLGFATGELEEYVGTLTLISLTDLVSDLSLHLGFALLLTAVYEYLNLRRRWIYYLVISLLGLELLLIVLLGKRDGSITDSGIPMLLVVADYIRVSWIGRRTGDPDARLPWNSLRAALYCLLLMLVIGIGTSILENAIDVDLDDQVEMVPILLLAAISLFSIPVGLSLSLVRDYARTHRSLLDNLREVEQLSARTLAQEQEKQQILARQNEVLEQQVAKRTAELNESLEHLKTTQEQLVQREKLASLGELTAGIAHEIQNPLNFVNNFAEVSVELVDELREERNRPERDAELEAELLDDLGMNARKISEHGKRAASIVRGMLLHSRASSGQKQSVDVNALTDEYMRLAYHGLRAKDKSFNAQLTTDFSPDLPTVSMVPEDIGRVLVNLFNNAFYAVQLKTKQSIPGYVPTVSVRTESHDGTVSIHVRDNGPGISGEVKQKVFQPFFTTKPTGEGTGLGLSLSYDIVSKGHGGTLRVDSEPGKYTEFVITLMSKN